jgi:hypothetical protein
VHILLPIGASKANHAKKLDDQSQKEDRAHVIFLYASNLSQ